MKGRCTRVLLFGGNGQVGTDLRAALAPYAVIAPTRGECAIENAAAVEQQVQESSPDWVINSAALTRVDDCESEPESALAVNALGARNVALACRRHRARVVYISTDYVFDGRTTAAYGEGDTPNPLNVYGVSKLAGEYFTRHLAPEWLLIRTSTVFGPGCGERPGANFVEAIVRQSAFGRPLRVVDDQISSPTFSRDLARAIVELIAADARGVYHVTNQGHCSFHELACATLEMCGCRVEVQRISSSELNRPAQRPAFSVLENARWRREGFSSRRHWKEALQEYLSIHHSGKGMTA